MCDDDFLLTYNPECLERHSDSSDFEDISPQRLGGNHSILRRKLFRHNKMESQEKNTKCKRHKKGYGRTECVYDNHAVHPRHCECNECVIPVEEKQNQTMLKRRKVTYRKQGDTNAFLQPTPSRLSLVRSKIMPCLSSIFGRSNHSKRDDSCKNNHVIINSTKDNYCQVYCVKCNHKRLTSKKLNNAIRTNYSTDDGLDNAPDSGINVDSLAGKNTATKDSSISCDFSSSSYSTNMEATKLKFGKIIEKEIKKAYLRRQYLKRKREDQPPKANFQVFSSTKSSNLKNMSSNNELGDKNSFGCNVVPSNSSVFWEYLVDRINKKYQNRDVTVKSCHCTNTQPLPTNTQPCPYMESFLREASGPKLNEQTTQDACSCKTSPNNLQNQSPIEHQPQQNAQQPGIKLNNAPIKPGAPAIKKRSKEPDPVQCQCYPDKPAALNAKSPVASPPGSPGYAGAPGSPGQGEMHRPCQEPHDQIKASLEKKYNGEILCIHNPPCILINGCLNLPPVKTSPQHFCSAAWPVTQTASFHCGFQQTDIQKQTYEQGCQYQPPDGKYEMTVYKPKSEKITQSICHHNPPCEVVRRCYKPEFDPKLDNSCIHVPMCQKVPECVGDEKDMLECKHLPKCSELPDCKRQPKRYTVMTEKDNVCTRVKPFMKMECRHVPPCIMIPKCLGRLMCEGYVPYDAIPDCVHQPMCEMIPACCRKSAKMVSVHSQYPSPCRIV